MSSLSTLKLQKLNNIGQNGGFWYITKQNLVFRDLCFIAKILEQWNDSQNENYETFFDRKKILHEYGGFSAKTAHRATKNCEYLGLTRPSSNYSARYLTPYYYALKNLCRGDFNRLSRYPQIVNRQLERMFIDSRNNNQYSITIQISPFMFLFKILLLIGDITESYKISTSEFKLFVATAQNWNDYFEVVESILRYREDNDFQTQCDNNQSKVSDVRYNVLAQNHSQLEVTSEYLAIKAEDIKNIRRKVAEYEINEDIHSSEDVFLVDALLERPYQQVQIPL